MIAGSVFGLLTYSQIKKSHADLDVHLDAEALPCADLG